MIYKNIDSKEKEINQLKNLLKESENPKQQALIRADLMRIENGHKAEKDNAYYLDFGFKEKTRNIILHDIRLEENGQIAQIDHIIVNQLGIEVLESKSFTGTLTIKPDGSLDVEYSNKIQTFPNPIEQNNRHAQVLESLIKGKIELPSNVKLFGIPISSTVLINPKTTVTNETLPKGFERADSFVTHWDKKFDKMGTISMFKNFGKMMSLNKVKEIGDFLIQQHTPKTFDYSKKYPIKKEPMKKPTTVSKPIPSHKIAHCSKCQNTNIEIRYGKYGYYFKCLACDGNTSIKLTQTAS